MKSDAPPNPLEAAVECVIAQLGEEDAAFIKESSPDDLIMMHFGLRMWIRNNLGLWSGSPLRNFLEERGFYDEDGMSAGVIRAVRARLRVRIFRLLYRTKGATMPLEKLISGGQTGADHAALDVAIRHGFPNGGWCPTGRKSEDGPIGGQYALVESPKAGYLQRTEWNARDSDGTVVFTLAAEATGGPLHTIKFARKHKKPCAHISRAGDYRPAERGIGITA